MDEAWRFIQHPTLRAYVQEGLKTWRKHNGNGKVVGAIGVSGAPTVRNDIDCAKAALSLVPEP
jgi:uncharacterized protein GlcG (DUF336 family)